MTMWAFLILSLAALSLADNDFTYTGTPVPGLPFLITWTPGTYSEVQILLNTVIRAPIISTSVPIAENIPNNGHWTWNVPSDITGTFSFSIARDFMFPVSFSAPFTFGTPVVVTQPPPDTSIPQSTACTSATSDLPAPTGVNPFLYPNSHQGVRAGIGNDISWRPTTSGTVSLVMGSGSGDKDNLTIASHVPNSGSYSWTPDKGLANEGFSLASYEITIVSDADPTVISTSDEFVMLSPDSETSFMGPYVPAVLGQPYHIKWSPSDQPTISLVLQPQSAYLDKNLTIGDHVKNNGSFTWDVPKTSDFVVPGVWWLAAINDATGATDSRYELVIDATTPPTCGPVYYDVTTIAGMTITLGEYTPTITPSSGPSITPAGSILATVPTGTASAAITSSLARNSTALAVTGAVQREVSGAEIHALGRGIFTAAMLMVSSLLWIL